MRESRIQTQRIDERPDRELLLNETINISVLLYANKFVVERAPIGVRKKYSVAILWENNLQAFLNARAFLFFLTSCSIAPVFTYRKFFPYIGHQCITNKNLSWI